MNNKQTVDPLHAFDQMQAHSKNIVILIADYYRELIKENIPPDLAFKLTVDFQMMLWSIGQSK
jgi:hypothetical protein